MEDEKFFEYANLFLAYIKIISGKYENTLSLLKSALNINASSIKAYEYIGMLKETENCYEEAADYFSKAWELTERKDPTIGYKLALAYSECGKYVDSREVCHIVTNNFPQYAVHLEQLLAENGQMLRP